MCTYTVIEIFGVDRDVAGALQMGEEIPEGGPCWKVNSAPG